MPPPREEPAEWLRYAAEDLDAARTLLEAAPAMVRQSLFWIQQAAEKALKAFLIGNGRQYPMTHDLDRLRMLCSALDSAIDPVATECLGLASFAGLGRYPGESHLPSPDEAREMLDAAAALNSFVAGRLGIAIE